LALALIAKEFSDFFEDEQCPTDHCQHHGAHGDEQREDHGCLLLRARSIVWLSARDAATAVGRTAVNFVTACCRGL
jgi:hypothetical protein